jgi:site-specific recombinase XerD
MSVKLRWKTLKSGKKSAYLDIYHNGERKYEFLKIYISKNDTAQDKKERKFLIERIRAKKELELQASDYDYIPSFKKNIDFIEYFQTFVANYKKKDIRKIDAALLKLKSFCKKEKLSIKEITPIFCKNFMEYLTSEESGLSGGTPYDYWKSFKKVIKNAKIEGLISSDPSENTVWKNKVHKSGQLKKNILTKDELQLIAKTHCGNNEIKKAFLFACFTGLGATEIRKLTWSRITNNKLTIYREKTNEQVINELHPVALQLIGKRGKADETVFEKLPSDNGVNKCLKNWVARAGIEKKITFYCGRHTFATQLLLNGANLKTVADCLGHTTTSHTIKYLNYVDSLKSDAINKLPSIEL